MSQLDFKEIVNQYFSNGRFFGALAFENKQTLASLYKLIKNAANKGDPKAQYLMGIFCRVRNPELSLIYFQKSAAQFFDEEFLKIVKEYFLS